MSDAVNHFGAEHGIEPGETCRGCGRPARVHCLDCGSCEPDMACSVLCEASEEQRAVVFAEIAALDNPGHPGEGTSPRYGTRTGARA